MSSPSKQVDGEQRPKTRKEEVAERRSKANRRAVAGKLPALLENAQQPVPVQNLLRISDQELHRRLMQADLDTIMAVSGQTVSSLMARAEKAETSTVDALVISMIAHRAMRALEHCANQGNGVVAKELYRTVRLAVENLNILALNSPKLFKSTARDHIDWPVLHSPHDFFTTDIRSLQESLEIGKSFEFEVLKWSDRNRGPNLTLPQNYLAIRTIELLMRTRATPQNADSTTPKSTAPGWRDEAKLLPPFTHPNAEQWAEVGWKAVLEAYGNKLESDGFLKPLGRSRPEKKSTPGTIQNDIKERFKVAVVLLAKHQPTHE